MQWKKRARNYTMGSVDTQGSKKKNSKINRKGCEEQNWNSVHNGMQSVENSRGKLTHSHSGMIFLTARGQTSQFDSHWP